jgi:hypothetical protein
MCDLDRALQSGRAVNRRILFPKRWCVGLVALFCIGLVSSWALAAGETAEVHNGRQKRTKILRDFGREGWKTPPPETIVYVLGGNFDYSRFHLPYMSPARTAARQLGFGVFDSNANPNGSVAANAKTILEDWESILKDHEDHKDHKDHPGARIIVAANSKGYADLFHAAMQDASPLIKAAAAESRIGVFAVSPNWGGAPMAQTVRDHPWLLRRTKSLFSGSRFEWFNESLWDVTPTRRDLDTEAYRAQWSAGRDPLRMKTIIATAHMGPHSDGMVPLQHQRPPRDMVPHERWDFPRATHGSFTTAGWGWSASTRTWKAGLIAVSRQLGGPVHHP